MNDIFDDGMPDAKLLAVCVEIREAFSYFSEWDLPIGFEDRLNEALKPYGEIVNGEWVVK